MAVGSGPRKGERRATTKLREWLRDRIDPAERGNTAKLAEEAVDWLNQDADLLDEFLYEQVFNTTAEMVRGVIAATRSVKRFNEKADESEEDKNTRLRAWFDQMEHVSPAVGYVRLGVMTRPDLEQGASERERRVRKDATGARWFRTLASGLLNDEQTVEDRYTAAQVEAAYDSARAVVTARMDHILEGVEQSLREILYPDEGQQQPQTNGPSGPKPTK